MCVSGFEVGRWGPALVVNNEGRLDMDRKLRQSTASLVIRLPRGMLGGGGGGWVGF